MRCGRFTARILRLHVVDILGGLAAVTLGVALGTSVTDEKPFEGCSWLACLLGVAVTSLMLHWHWDERVDSSRYFLRFYHGAHIGQERLSVVDNAILYRPANTANTFDPLAFFI
mgnify:CR=1 FL=1